MREHVTLDVYDDFLAHDRIRSRLPTLPPGQSGLVRLKVLTPDQAQQDLATWISLVPFDSELQCWVLDFSKGCKCKLR